MIAIHYYEGAFGRTLRFEVQDRNDTERLRELFLGMSSNTDEVHENLCSEADFSCFGLGQFTWRRALRSGAAKLLLEPSSVQWSLTQSQWEECADLVEGLLTAGSGHQYLPVGESTDAVVLISMNEQH